MNVLDTYKLLCEKNKSTLDAKYEPWLLWIV